MPTWEKQPRCVSQFSLIANAVTDYGETYSGSSVNWRTPSKHHHCEGSIKLYQSKMEFVYAEEPHSPYVINSLHVSTAILTNSG